MSKKTTDNNLIGLINNLPIPNQVLSKNDFYISYNNIDTNIYGSDTTAIVLHDMSMFYILNGNHTQPLNECKTMGDVFDYFRNHCSEISKFSDKIPEV